MICLLYARVEQNRCTGSYWVAIGSPCRVEIVPRSSGWERHIGVRKRVIPVHLRIPGLLRRIHINERRPRRQDGIGRSGRDLGRDGRVLIHCSLGDDSPAP